MRVQDPAKFFAGTLTALSTMIQLEVPHINVLSKMDLYDRKQRGAIHRYRRRPPSARVRPSRPQACWAGADRDGPVVGWGGYRYLNADTTLLLADLNASTSSRFQALNHALASLVRADGARRMARGPPAGLTRPRAASGAPGGRAQIDEYGMVSFLPLNIRSERSVALVLSHVDNAMQYGEDEEPKDHDEVGGPGHSDRSVNPVPDLAPWRCSPARFLSSRHGPRQAAADDEP